MGTRASRATAGRPIEGDVGPAGGDGAEARDEASGNDVSGAEASAEEASAEEASAEEASAVRPTSAPPSRLLVVEDDRRLADFLVRALAEEGHAVEACRTGREALERLARGAYDAVVLDWTLPELDGLSVCRELRRLGDPVRILMLTARADIAERVAALDAGADDYLGKPFHLDELLARLRAITRRGPLHAPGSMLRIGPLTLSLEDRGAKVGGVRVDLTAREFGLLVLLARSAGRVVSRAQILARVWPSPRDPGSNVVDVHVRNLREKLGEAAPLLETIRGQGYRLAAPPATGGERQ